MTPAEIADLRGLRDAADNATSRGYRVVAVNSLSDWMLEHTNALLDAAEENARLREKVSSQFTAAFAKLRETLGTDIGCGGGLVEILTGIDGLREERDRLRTDRDALLALLESGQALNTHDLDVLECHKKWVIDDVAEVRATVHRIRKETDHAN